MYILLFILLIIIIITSYIKGSAEPIITVLNSSHHKLLLDRFTDSVYLGRNTEINGYMYEGEFLLYDGNKIKQFSPFFSKKVGPISKHTKILLETYYKKNIKKHTYNHIDFMIYNNELPHILQLDPQILGFKYMSPDYLFRKIWCIKFTNNPNILSYKELEYIEKTGKGLEKLPMHFFNRPSTGEIYKWYKLLKSVSAKNNKRVLILCATNNLDLICALYMLNVWLFFIPFCDINSAKTGINSERYDKYKRTQSLMGTFYKPYDLYIFDNSPTGSPPYSKYILDTKIGKIKKNTYNYTYPQIIDIKDLYSYKYMIIKKIQNERVWLEPHTYITDKTIIFPYVNNMFYWDLLINIWYNYMIVPIIESNIEECLGIIDVRIVVDRKLMPINYFNEEERAKCRRKTQEYSMIDYFTNVVKKDKKLTTNYEKFVEAYSPHIYFRMKIIACSEFNPEWAYTLISHYGARRVLDMSAGRGARLLGALLAGCDYYLGIDPNEATNINIRSLGQFYKHIFKLKTDFDIIDSGFEVPWEEKLSKTNANLFSSSKLRKFDLLISSPPYYDLEIYVPFPGTSSGKKEEKNEKENKQSIWNKTFEEWIDQFLIFSVCKAVRFIKTGGHIIINIDNSINKNVLEDYTTPLKTSKKIKEAGAQYIGYYRLKDTIPCTFWIFKII